MRQLVALSLMQQQNASDRLRGVNYTYRVEPDDPQVLSALLTTVNHDPSVNVRLAAVDALRKFTDGPVGRRRPGAGAWESRIRRWCRSRFWTRSWRLRERSAAPAIQVLEAGADVNPGSQTARAMGAEATAMRALLTFWRWQRARAGLWLRPAGEGDHPPDVSRSGAPRDRQRRRLHPRDRLQRQRNPDGGRENHRRRIAGPTGRGQARSEAGHLAVRRHAETVRGRPVSLPLRRRHAAGFTSTAIAATVVTLRFRDQGSGGDHRATGDGERRRDPRGKRPRRFRSEQRQRRHHADGSWRLRQRSIP